MRGDSRRGKRVNACKTLVGPKNTRSATRLIIASRFELPLLGSNQDSPDPESGVLPVTPRGTGSTTYTAGSFGLWKPELRGTWCVVFYHSQPPAPESGHAPSPTHAPL